MDGSSLVALFVLGLSGTSHCIGMCGPLVFAFPGKTGRLGPHLCYHAGRITTYTGMGILMGSVGLAVAQIASLGGVDYLATIARLQESINDVMVVCLAQFINPELVEAAAEAHAHAGSGPARPRHAPGAGGAQPQDPAARVLPAPGPG